MRSCLRIAALLLLLCSRSAAGEVALQILSPKDGARIQQEQDLLLLTGKVSAAAAQKPNVDILFVLDVSGSTANYAGVDFGDPDSASAAGWGRPTIGFGGFGIGSPPVRNLRSSILAAEVAASRRLLSQLNPETTRVGVVTFAEDGKLRQPLTSDFDLVRQALDSILAEGPRGGTNMAAGIRLAVRELAGLGQSPHRNDAIKAQFFLTDGIPTLPIGGSRRAAPEDSELAINAARTAGKAGIKIHVFALGEEALSYPVAAVGIARASGGVFTPVVRPADILAVLERLSAVGVTYVQVFNQTTSQRAEHVRLAADGFFSAAVPVAEGANRIQVLARADDGRTRQESISVYYQRSQQRALDVEVFLERERKLRSGLQTLGKNEEQLEREVRRAREESASRSPSPPPADEGPAR